MVHKSSYTPAQHSFLQRRLKRVYAGELHTIFRDKVGHLSRKYTRKLWGEIAKQNDDKQSPLLHIINIPDGFVLARADRWSVSGPIVKKGV